MPLSCLFFWKFEWPQFPSEIIRPLAIQIIFYLFQMKKRPHDKAKTLWEGHKLVLTFTQWRQNKWDIFQIVVVFENLLEILTMVLCTYPAVLAQGVERVGLLVFRVLLELRWALWTACARLAVAEWPLRSNWGLGLFRCFVSWIQAKVAPVMRSPVNLIKSRALLFSMNIWKQFYQSLILSM